MLATVFGARRRARKAPPKAAKPPPEAVRSSEPEKERQKPRKRKLSSEPPAAPKETSTSSPPPPPAPTAEPESRGSKTSGAARRRLAKAKAQAEAEVQVPLEAVEADAGEALSQAALNAVQVSGPGCESEDLKPWLSFSEVQAGGPKGKLPQVVTSYMAQYRSFRQPTPIQAYCWPAACAGRNILGISKTGSGKTLAFLCPGLARVLSFRSSPTPSFGPYVLVIAPTSSNFVSGYDRRSLSMVHYVVLDEADCMLELGFEHQVRRLLGKVNAKHQILCFSATWPPKVELLAKERVKNAIRIEVGANHATGISGNSNCEQHVRCLRQSTAEAKTRELIRLLRLHKEACIVFCATKKRTAQLGRELREASFAVRALHGDLPQADRYAAVATLAFGLNTRSTGLPRMD
ncbi:putative DEAD-box RNA helicase HEL64 [Symbiodinium microadriaticum]|uniref:Putative DEAD-box RNA helicase HEL64 n=1 Tax=Symbiodinium microadriaticum TaxID=2951 RepID=A0A1Q9E3S4_SYMMI|nr:putative DEAD-box RNA helicase HEL64 [Symbiodinium microadriaticum]